MGEGYFLLPDDFRGSRADALRLLADYDEAQDETQVIPDAGEDRWTRFLAALEKGRRLHGSFSVQEREDGEEWRFMPENDPRGRPQA